MENDPCHVHNTSYGTGYYAPRSFKQLFHQMYDPATTSFAGLLPCIPLRAVSTSVIRTESKALFFTERDYHYTRA